MKMPDSNSIDMSDPQVVEDILKRRQRYVGDDGTIKERPNPRDVKIEQIADARFDWEEIKNARAKRMRSAFGVIRECLRSWFMEQLCHVMWHDVDEETQGLGYRVCKRCGSWRGTY